MQKILSYMPPTSQVDEDLRQIQLNSTQPKPRLLADKLRISSLTKYTNSRSKSGEGMDF